MRLLIDRELTDLNSYVNAERSNRFAAAKIKEEETNFVRIRALQSGLRPIGKPVIVTCHFYCKDKRKDKDNVMFAQKFILDGLVKAGVIKSDGWNWVDIGKPLFSVDKDFPRVEVYIEPF